MDSAMAKVINHDHLVIDCSQNTVINNSNNSNNSNTGTTFPSNHHLLVKHSTIETYQSGCTQQSSLPNTAQTQHQLISANSFELNGVTTSSLSEDSGLPPTTNSSISSGDSTRMGLCKFEFELVESDGEVSQFDSLDNCSDGGMSTENFNTLKKGPLAPIDPPPEFQDSPQTTLLRSPALQSYSTKLTKNILTTAITICSTMATKTLSELPITIVTKTKSLELLDFDDEKTVNYPILRLKNHPLSDDPIILSNDIESDNNNLYELNEYHLYQRPQDYNHYHTYDIYASDSILNRHIDNIYDVPCDEYSTNVTTSNESINKLTCENYHCFDNETHQYTNDNNRVNKLRCNKVAIKDIQRENQIKMERASEIHDYELYYRNDCNSNNSSETNLLCSATTSTASLLPTSSSAIASACTASGSIASINPSSSISISTINNIHTKSYSLSQTVAKTAAATTTTSTTSSSTSTSATTFQRRKTPSILYSPLHYHASSNLSTGNRPNSRNSLNSRLSSSHNSLTITTSNKADDSIFITQAMSHDALTGREISDFYNVPIDSDIYALPIDVIRPISRHNSYKRNHKSLFIGVTSTSTILTGLAPKDTNIRPSPSNLSLLKTSKNFRGRLKYVRNNKKRKRQQHNNGDGIAINGSVAIPIKSNKSNGNVEKRHSVPDNVIEPMHMTLDEVKRLYTSLYSSSSDSVNELNSNVKLSNGRLGKVASTCVAGMTSSKNYCNNNNNNLSSFNNNNSMVIFKSDRNFNLPHVNNNNNNNNNVNNNNLNNNNLNNQCKSTSTLNAASCASSATTPATTATTATPNQLNSSSNNLSKLSNLKINANKNVSSSNCNIKNVSSSNNIAKENDCISVNPNVTTNKKSQFSINLKQKFCSIFRFRKSYQSHQLNHGNGNAGNNQRSSVVADYDTNIDVAAAGTDKKVKFSTRALPPLPPALNDLTGNGTRAAATAATVAITATTPTPIIMDLSNETDENDDKKANDLSPMDFAANIEKVKEYGWYWGPISSEAAEKILSNEPDGSFIVRDSSDDHYIFSLTFKLNNCVRHVRIEQDQGTFSFGSCAKFKSRTIMEFIENAVESSRSGRYLFFFHRRPEHGPMRVQLTNPVSRFKHIQSLQHMCRFVIRRTVVRKDLIQTLPLPRRLLDYLSYKNCYSEQVESDSSQSPTVEVETSANEGTDEHIILR